MTIDGYSQPGASPNTLTKGTNAKLMIELKGSDTGLYGLGIVADNTVVRRLVINGFQNSGIAVSGPDPQGSTGVRLEGNFIGTDPSGTQENGNGNHGVNIFGSEVTVGGAPPAKRNIISGNAGHGVLLVECPGVRVLGNLIGTKKDAKGALGNSASGVAIIGGANAVVGGAKPAAANTIAYNAGRGVQISESVSTGNRILNNSIFSNGNLGIDLSGDGITPNDGAGDADVGPNELQNFPLITRATTSKRATAIGGRLDSIASETYVVRFFSNPSGGEEGKRYIGQKTVVTDGQGNATFTFKPARKVRIGKTITATATDSSGNTSEFSAPKIVVAK